MAGGEGEEPQHSTGRQGMKRAKGSGEVKENPSEALWTVLQGWGQGIRAERHLGELNTESKMQEQREVPDDTDRWQPGYLRLLCFMYAGLWISVVLGSLNLNLWFLHQLRLLLRSWVLYVSSTLWKTLPRKNPFWKRCSIWVLPSSLRLQPQISMRIHGGGQALETGAHFIYIWDS